MGVVARGPARFAAPLCDDDASWVGFRLAEILPLREVFAVLFFVSVSLKLRPGKLRAVVAPRKPM